MRLTQEDVERWRNRQLSMMVNSLPVWNGALNIGGDSLSHLTSAEKAKIRLHGVVAQDRKACGDGKWVKVRNRRLCGIPWQISLSDSPIAKELVKEWEREDKLAYRWKYRR